MQNTLSKQQEREIGSYIKEITQKIEDEDYQPTAYDQLLMVYYPVQRGIRKNGYTIEDIAQLLGVDVSDHRTLCYLRTNVCMFSSTLVRDGKPFGALKDGRYKKWGYAEGHEMSELSWDRKKRHVAETIAIMKYLPDDDQYKRVCNGVIKEYDKQLKFIGFEANV